jgi:crossover junction endodeoxyribonuclease RuvC
MPPSKSGRSTRTESHAQPAPRAVEPADGAPRPARVALVPPGCDWPVVLGFDPGTRVVGYGSVVLAPDGPRLLAAGVIRAPARAPLAERLRAVREGVERELARISPGVVVVERAFAARNVQSAFRIGEARGVILACAAHSGAEVCELSPAEAKKAVLGNGAGSKQQVARMVERLLRIGELGAALDATDALALALGQVKRMQWAATVRRTRA